MTTPIYTEHPPRERCENCRHRGYDSCHDEMYCRHDPPPDNLGPMGLIYPHGWCEFWEDDP